MSDKTFQPDGTTAAIFLAICATLGFMGYEMWYLLPIGVAASVIAAHTPPGRAEAAREDGTYWKQYIGLIPAMIGAFALAYALGWGVSWVIFEGLG